MPGTSHKPQCASDKELNDVLKKAGERFKKLEAELKTSKENTEKENKALEVKYKEFEEETRNKIKQNNKQIADGERELACLSDSIDECRRYHEESTNKAVRKAWTDHLNNLADSIRLWTN